MYVYYLLAPGLLTLAVKFDIVSIRSLCDRLVSELIEDADLDDALVVSWWSNSHSVRSCPRFTHKTLFGPF